MSNWEYLLVKAVYKMLVKQTPSLISLSFLWASYMTPASRNFLLFHKFYSFEKASLHFELAISPEVNL